MKKVFTFLLCLTLFTACFGNTECFICPECPRCGYPAELVVEDEQSGIPPGMMEVFVFGIGRSDAILIMTENHTVLIDTGENRDGIPIVGTLNSRGITKLDYLIITHFDRDHVGGAHHIINSSFIEVENVVVPNYSRVTRHVQRFETAMENVGLEPIVLTEPMRFALDGAHFVIDPSDLPYMSIDVQNFEDEEDDFEEEGEDDDDEGEFIPTGDDFAIVVMVEHFMNDFIFMADATTHRRQQLLDSPDFMAIDFDFMKVGRHGRLDRRIPRFIRQIAPSHAVITGFHPSQADMFYPERPTDERVLELLDEVGAEVFFTMNSHFAIRSNGRELLLDW